MRLAFSTNAFTRFSLADALAGIAGAGFSAVEVLADMPHAFVKTMTASDVADVRKALARNRLSVSNVNANCTFGYWKDAPPEAYFEPSLISPNDKHRADRMELIHKTIDFAHDIGATNISITSGRCTGDVSPDRAAIRLVDALRPLLDYADTRNVDVGIELEPGTYLEFVTELRDLIGQLNHPRLGANLDIGHSVVNGERIDESVLALARRIWNVHVEDLPGRKHYHTIPGRGSFDWAQLFSALRSVGYDRCLTVELYTMTTDPHGAARESYAFLNAALNTAVSV